MKKIVVTAIAGIAFGMTGVANATTSSEQVALCEIALVDEGLIDEEAYDARFVKTRGGGVKTVTVKLVPFDEGESKMAKCKIKRGEVTEATLVA
ncbi:MAG: hypothetical protein AAFR21_08250 [Pseudomonadota bacterium]